MAMVQFDLKLVDGIYLFPKDMLSLLRSERSGPSEALRAFLPAVVVDDVLAVLPLAMGDEAFEREALDLAFEPFLVGSFAGGWVRFLMISYCILECRRNVPLLDNVCL